MFVGTVESIIGLHHRFIVWAVFNHQQIKVLIIIDDYQKMILLKKTESQNQHSSPTKEPAPFL